MAKTADAVAVIEAQLPAELESVVAARQMVTSAAEDWRLDPLRREDAALVVSELVANVVLHARTPFTLRVSRIGSGMRIEVSDGDERLPDVAAVRPEDLLETRSMTGRGLSLVSAMSDRWGAQPERGGKVVWAEVGSSRRRVEPEPAPSFPPVRPATHAKAYAPAGVTRVTALAAGGRPVHLVGVPVRLLVESVRQLTDLQREIQVIGLDHNGPPELQALADTTREIDAHIGHLRDSGLAAAERALASGAAVVDVDMVVPDDAGDYFDRLGALLGRVRTRIARRYLLTLPASEEVTAYRMWWRDEVVSQLAGSPPSRCPFGPSAGA